MRAYNTVNFTNDPDVYGFPSGVYYDNSTLYPGTGNFNNAGGQNPGNLSHKIIFVYLHCFVAAARIMTTNSLKGPGAYLSAGGGELFENVEAKYFEKHPDLNWFKVHTNNAANIPGVIKMWRNSNAVFSSFARIDQIVNGKSFKILGKFESWANAVYFTQSDLVTETSFQGIIEVLACQPAATAQSPCGKLIYLNLLVLIFCSRNFCGLRHDK